MVALCVCGFWGLGLLGWWLGLLADVVVVVCWFGFFVVEVWFDCFRVFLFAFDLDL